MSPMIEWNQNPGSIRTVRPEKEVLSELEQNVAEVTGTTNVKAFTESLDGVAIVGVVFPNNGEMRKIAFRAGDYELGAQQIEAYVRQQYSQ